MKKILFLLLITFICIGSSSCSDINENSNTNNVIKSGNYHLVGHYYNEVEIISKLNFDVEEEIEIESTVVSVPEQYMVYEIIIEAHYCYIYTADGSEYNEYLSIKKEDFEKNGIIFPCNKDGIVLSDGLWEYYIEEFKFKYKYPNNNVYSYILFKTYAEELRNPANNQFESVCMVSYEVKDGKIYLS